MGGTGLVNVDLNPGSIIAAIGDTLDKLFTSDDERAKAKIALLQLEQTGQLEELKTRLSAILAEAQSSDPWTSRARPAFLYLMYLVVLLCVVGGVSSIWFPGHVQSAAQGFGNLLSSIPDALWTLFGAGYLGYAGARSFEKVKGVTK